MSCHPAGQKLVAQSNILRCVTFGAERWNYLKDEMKQRTKKRETAAAPSTWLGGEAFSSAAQLWWTGRPTSWKASGGGGSWPSQTATHSMAERSYKSLHPDFLKKKGGKLGGHRSFSVSDQNSSYLAVLTQGRIDSIVSTRVVLPWKRQAFAGPTTDQGESSAQVEKKWFFVPHKENNFIERDAARFTGIEPSKK